jgi:hypothetical protein
MAMQDVLSAALREEESDADDRVLAAAFFRKRPLQAGSSPMASVVRLADRQRPTMTTTTTTTTKTQPTATTDIRFLDRWRTTLK